MKISTTQNKTKIKLWAVLFWLLIWQALSMWVGWDILLVSPLKVLLCFKSLIFTGEFWSSIGFSMIRILGGFLTAVVFSIIMAAAGSCFKRIRELLYPLMEVMKATPVASFIVVALIWISSKNLSVLITFIMATPILYTNICEGIARTDRELLEMADIFEISFKHRLRYIYIPQAMPYFKASAITALGICWKAGIAAEVIGIPTGSIGEKLYNAKVYFNTPELFAWTVTIVVISVAIEKLFILVMDRIKTMG